VKHRHIEARTDGAAEALSSAEVVDLLHRGDLSDWRPLLSAIARAPEGELADRVLELVDRFPTYGTSGLLRSWIDRRRVAARSLEARATAASLRLLRQRMGLTQVQLAERMHMTQSDLSKFERRRDVRLSTLAAYIAALGGRLDLSARLPDGTYRITLARPHKRSAPKPVRGG
jgi:DNA-binding XRE family transcriptional regulator